MSSRKFGQVVCGSFFAEFGGKSIGDADPKTTAYKRACREGLVWNIWSRWGRCSWSLNRRQVGGRVVTGRLGRSIGSKHAEATRGSAGERGIDAGRAWGGRGKAVAASTHLAMIGGAWGSVRVCASRASMLPDLSVGWAWETGNQGLAGRIAISRHDFH